MSPCPECGEAQVQHRHRTYLRRADPKLSQADAWLSMAGAGRATSRLRQSGALSTAPAVHTQTSMAASPVGLARLVAHPRRSLADNVADRSCSLVGRVVGA